MHIRRSTTIQGIEVAAYRIPTEAPEADGTFEWQHTTLVVVEVLAGNETGLGYTYADSATATLIRDSLADVVVERDAMAVRGIWNAMCASVRNLGRPGVCATAISAVDSALWDLKARVLGMPLVSLLGPVREALPLYGSGGFTNSDVEKLREQLGGWVQSGISRVKMKVGRDAKADIARTAAARDAIGPAAQLFVDANGAYTCKQALAQAEAFAGMGVTWFEEPVSSDDLDGLRLLRERAPAGMDIAAGEYGYDADYFRRMVSAGAVDVLQADATRCCGITGFLDAGALCGAFHVPMSSHCAPALHLHPGCAVSAMRHAEYFFDHVRIEQMLFEGVPRPEHGALRPDLSRAGHGLTFKRQDAARYEV